MFMALPNCSGIWKQGTPSIGPTVKEYHLQNPILISHCVWLSIKSNIKNLAWKEAGARFSKNCRSNKSLGASETLNAKFSGPKDFENCNLWTWVSAKSNFQMVQNFASLAKSQTTVSVRLSALPGCFLPLLKVTERNKWKSEVEIKNANLWLLKKDSPPPLFNVELFLWITNHLRWILSTKPHKNICLNEKIFTICSRFEPARQFKYFMAYYFCC